MSALFIASAVFIAAHLIPSHPPLRQFLVSKMGERPFMSIYGIFSLGLFIWLIKTYLEAPYVELWLIQDWMRYGTLVLMFFVCLLLVCTFSQPNPFSLGIGGRGFDPENPGIVGATKHPAFIAFAGWSFSHILPNGDLASLIFFGLMGALSLYGPSSLNKKRRLQLGAATWQDLQNQTKKGWPQIGLVRILVASLLYIALIFAHEPVIGVIPIP